MLEERKLLFITSGQRITITIIFVGAILTLGFLIYLSLLSPLISNLTQPLFDVLKLLLTGFAFWGLVLLYASSNSPGRIRSETLRFFSNDLVGAFSNNGFRNTNTGHGREIQLLFNESGIAVLSVVGEGQVVLYVWAQLNVFKLQMVFLLPPKFAPNYQEIYQESIIGFKRDGITLDTFGIQTQDIEGVLKKPEPFLKLYVLRKLQEDFLFNAAARTYIANVIFGDTRSLFVETQRHEREDEGVSPRS